MMVMNWLHPNTMFLSVRYVHFIFFYNMPEIIQRHCQTINKKLESKVMYQSFLKEGCATILINLMVHMTASNYQLKVENSEQWEA